MSVKQVWAGMIGNIRSRLVYRYPEGETMRTAPRVSMVVLVNEGREEGRMIEVLMTPEEAERRANALLDAARKTRDSDIKETTELG